MASKTSVSEPTRPHTRRARAVAPTLSEAQAFVDSHRDEGIAELFGITELCKEFGITLRALRFYEDKGLLAPRRINGARVYTRRDRARLALILRAKDIGSPLSEIKRYLDLYGDHGEGRAQQLSYVIDRTDTAIKELEQKRDQIDETLAELQLINATSRKHLETRRQIEASSVPAEAGVSHLPTSQAPATKRLAQTPARGKQRKVTV